VPIKKWILQAKWDLRFRRKVGILIGPSILKGQDRNWRLKWEKASAIRRQTSFRAGETNGK
jgi:hypothetical protein